MAKVIILHNVLGKSKGGVETWVYYATEELLNQGHKVTVLNTERKMPSDGVPQGVEVININPKKVIPSVFFLRSSFNLKKELKGRLKEYDFIWSRSFVLAWVASKLVTSVRPIYINAAPYSYYAYRPFRFLLKNNKGFKGLLKTFSYLLSYKVAHILEKNAIMNSTNVFLSTKRKEQTIEHFRLKDNEKQFMVVPPGVDTKKFSPNYITFSSRETFKIIALARLAKDKNFQCIIQSVKELKQQGYNVHLTIVGDGVYKSELLQLVRDLKLVGNVTFAGRQQDVENWYNKNHLFVLPSLYEGFGNVYVEAMASGLPVIAISGNNNKYNVAVDEIIDHGIDGFLMKENNPNELAKYVKYFIENPNKISEMGQNAREKATKVFTWKNTIDRMLKISIK